MSQFLLILDYADRFLLSVQDLQNYRYASMDTERVCNLLRQYGHTVNCVRYADLDLTRRYDGYYVLYQSAEDVGVFYKDYLEDIAYYLEMQGATLLPRYTYLLAHHNKNFMELLRNSFHDELLKSVKSRVYGTAEEALHQTHPYPVVVKSAEGSGSRNVFLARNHDELSRIVKHLSGVFIINDWQSVQEYVIYWISQKLIKRMETKYSRYPFYRKKFIVQNFIPGLQGDYKVLYFGGKYFAAYRGNRDNDFRASGSGRTLVVPEVMLPGLLDFARRLTLEIDFPIMSMDIGFDQQNYHLFEFQCIHIGPYALQCSDSWYEYVDGRWLTFQGKADLHEEFCRSIHAYVRELEERRCPTA